MFHGVRGKIQGLEHWDRKGVEQKRNHETQGRVPDKDFLQNREVREGHNFQGKSRCGQHSADYKPEEVRVRPLVEFDLGAEMVVEGDQEDHAPQGEEGHLVYLQVFVESVVVNVACGAVLKGVDPLGGSEFPVGLVREQNEHQLQPVESKNEPHWPECCELA